jgi:hypothetical protein
MTIRDSEIARLIDAWEDEHPEPGPDEDTLRAYFAGQLHADWPRAGWLAGYGGVVAAVLIGAVLALLVVWAVTA